MVKGWRGGRRRTGRGIGERPLWVESGRGSTQATNQLVTQIEEPRLASEHSRSQEQPQGTPVTLNAGDEARDKAEKAKGGTYYAENATPL
jgi:hypothetical protein